VLREQVLHWLAAMARPLRPQFPGAIYHLICRGNAQQEVFADHADRQRFLRMLAETTWHRHWSLFAYCLMNNHYHLCVETTEATLASGMRDLNGRYAQSFNRRHTRVGHLFQSRYRAIVVERSSQFLSLIRYIVRNPVRAGLCRTPADWPWSSHLATIGLTVATLPLATNAVLDEFDSSPETARRLYEVFVTAEPVVVGEELDSRNPVVSGRQAFASEVVRRASNQSTEMPRRQRTGWSLEYYELNARERDEAIRLAWSSGGFSLMEIGRHFGLHYSTISKICRGAHRSLVAQDVVADAHGGDQLIHS
jgi:putative transposase